MNKNIKDIKIYINNVISKNFNINILQQNLSHENFFGDKIGLFARHLIFILYDIERKYSVKLPENELIHKDIYSLDTLSETIFFHLK